MTYDFMKIKTRALHIVKLCGPHVTRGSHLAGLLYKGNEDYKPTNNSGHIRVYEEHYYRTYPE